MDGQEELLSKIFAQIKTIKEKIFTPEEMMIQEEEIKTRREYEELIQKYHKYSMFDSIINDIAWNASGHVFYFQGYCAICGRDTIMYYTGKEQKNIRQNGNTHFFREEFFCINCKCNSRLRYMIQKMRKEYKRGMGVYLYERVTPAYDAISQFIPEDDLTGSEYFGTEYSSGEYVNGILHEDAAHLSFQNDSFDLILSMDVFEHTYYYENVFKEAYRILKPGGKLLLTIPMRPLCDRTVERAKIIDGEVIYIMESLMHGDPMSPQGGILEFIMYGWDIIEIMKSIGFREVKMKTYYSINDVYLGCIPFYFELIK